MENMEIKFLERINFESIPDELGDDLCLVRGYLLMVQDPNSDWSYGYHIKYQGGGTFGDYHFIAKWSFEGNYWDFAYGDFYEPFEGDLIETASKLEGFNVDNALNMFEKVNKLFYKTVRNGGQVKEDTPESYNSSFLIYKSKLDNNEFESNSFWYRKDEFSHNDNIAYLDVESISEMIPGNMIFLD